MAIKRVKILDTDFNKDKSIVKWTIRDLDEDKKLTLVMPSDDVGPSVGINAKIPEDALVNFLDQMIGKEINWDLKAEVEDFDGEEFKKEGAIEKIYNEHNRLDKYPFYEILKEIEEEEDEN